MSTDTTPHSPDPFHWHYAEFDDSNFQIRGRTVFFIIVVFSIVIFIMLLFIYSKWVCRYQLQATPSVSAVQVTHAPHAPPQGLDPATIRNLPIVLHKSHGSVSTNMSQLECSICLGMFQDGEKVKFLPDCHHCYHCECVDKWLITQSSCPLCRASLRVDSVV